MGDDRVALVTGASRGIGRAVAAALAAAGMRVFLVADGTREELGRAAKACEAAHPRGAPMASGVFDLALSDAPHAAVEAALGAFGRLDVLVSNAGIRLRQPFLKCTADDFDRMVAVNLRAGFLLAQAATPALRAAGSGRMIFVASQLGIVADAGAALYGMTKAALIHLVKSLALELAADGISVNAVSPGPIAAEAAANDRDPGLLARRLAAIPLQRLGRPEEVAAAVAFLATTEATFIHGANLVVDGGFVIQ
jgi:NAD(P)-dependent dehydrogenase (short-subunit alcohol dehydrogenase family)